MSSLDYDLARLAAGWRPGPAELAGAPVLQSWTVLQKLAGRVLVGNIHGHPCIPEGRLGATSPLAWLDPEDRYARTRSRWYDLGTPAITRHGDIQ